MKRLILLIMMIELLVSPVFAGNPLGFRDIHLRMPMAEARELMKSYEKNNPNIVGIYINYIDGMVDTILVRTTIEAQESFKEAVYKKYGRPNYGTKEFIYQNSFGAKFKGFMSIWKINGDYVVLDLAPDTANQMRVSLLLATHEWRERNDTKDFKI